jgi:ribosomal-protein-alanine N-acetyltransferase
MQELKRPDEGSPMTLDYLEIRKLSPEWVDALSDFFMALSVAGDYQYFHPHPLTPEEAIKHCDYSGKDLYYVLVSDNQILGYGMLRGWDEGYEIPSLGIALHPSMRGKGLGKVFMQFLHLVAQQRGAKKIRLKVYPDNVSAVTLYRNLGYLFQPTEDGQLLGIISLF